MVEITISQAIEAPAEKVWALVGGFDHMPSYLDAVTSSSLEKGGRARRLVLADGGWVVEPLLYFDDRERILTWGVGESEGCDFPFTELAARFTVSEKTPGEACELRIWCRYEPIGGREREAEELLGGYFVDCSKGVRRALGV